MAKRKFKVKSGSVQETFLLPLWGRAYETTRPRPRLTDRKAVEVLARIDYDFDTIAKTQEMSQHGWIARSLFVDRAIRSFIADHPRATIVNLGCGMDTTFSRIDNGEILFYELDLPDVMAMRRQLMGDEQGERHRYIASSFLDTDYFEQIEVNDGLFFFAGGVLMYFSEAQVKGFFISLADYFKRCEVYFDYLSPRGINVAKKMVLKKGGMDTQFGEGWGIKPARKINAWDPRLRIQSDTPMYREVRKGLPLKQRLMLTMSDWMGFGAMAHLQIG